MATTTVLERSDPSDDIFRSELLWRWASDCGCDKYGTVKSKADILRGTCRIRQLCKLYASERRSLVLLRALETPRRSSFEEGTREVPQEKLCWTLASTSCARKVVIHVAIILHYVPVPLIFPKLRTMQPSFVIFSSFVFLGPSKLSASCH